MVEICKQITINIFWMLAATFQVALATAIVIGVLNRFLKKLQKDDKDNKE